MNMVFLTVFDWQIETGHSRFLIVTIQFVYRTWLCAPSRRSVLQWIPQMNFIF